MLAIKLAQLEGVESLVVELFELVYRLLRRAAQHGAEFFLDGGQLFTRGRGGDCVQRALAVAIGIVNAGLLLVHGVLHQLVSGDSTGAPCVLQVEPVHTLDLH